MIPHTGVQQTPSQNASSPGIDGWYTNHPDAGGVEHPIEHWESGFNSVPSQEGNFFVELNAYQPSRLYQIVYLVNGETIEYSYYHRKRIANQTETIEFSIYSQDGATKLYTMSTNTASGTGQWDHGTGSFTFAGSTGIYQIGFEATSPSTGGSGNFLDNINIGLDGLVEFSHDEVTVNEGNNSYRPHILINGDVQTASTITFSVASTDASAGVDYNFNPVTVNIPIGKYGLADSIQIPMSIVDNALSQGLRTVELTISSTTGDVEAKDANGNGYKQTLTIHIEDNDPAVGGIQGSKLWLKADQGVNHTGAVLNNWADQTGGNTFTKVGSIDYLENAINFHPTVQFQNTNPKNQDADHRLEGNNDITVAEVYAVYKYNTSSQAGVVLGGVNAGSNYGKAIMAADGDLRVYFGVGVNNTYQSYGNPDLVNKFTINNLDVTPTTTPFAAGRLDGAIQTINPHSSTDFSALTLTPMIGATENNGASDGWFYLNGQIAEIVTYPRSLNTGERTKIESYLGLKYGISLDPSVNSYRSSSNTIYWNRTTHWNDVFGIGQDDGSGLTQSSSNSINTGSGDGTGQAGKGNIVISNPASMNNNEFLMVGHDGGTLDDQTADMPTSLQNMCLSRIAREWKVQRTGDVGSVTLTFDFNGLTLSGALGTDATQFGILIDTDGDGDFSTGSPTTIQATAKNGDVISFSNLNLPNNAVFSFYMPVDLSNASTDTRSECSPFTWIDGNDYTADNNTATHVLQNQFGCDSTVTLDLTILPNPTGVDVIADCNAITWIDGNTYSSDNNTATFTIVGGGANGCDSIVTLDYTHLPTAFGTDTRSECAPFTWIDGNSYSADTTGAKHTIIGGASDGCDSVVTLDLTILPNAFGTDVVNDCNAITWIDGNTYTSSNNTATHVLPGAAANGCDSIVTLNYTHLPTAFGTDTRNECAPFTWIDGNTYSSDTSGVTHNLIGAAADGCDSIVTLNLTIKPNAFGTDIIAQCDALTWIDGMTYNASNNTATHVLPGAAANGCDSIVTLNYTRYPVTYGSDAYTECVSYTWIDGNTYTSSNNTATMTFVNQYGCDSIVTLDLTIISPANYTDVITACQSYTWIDGYTYTTSNNTAQYIIPSGAANGCDSIITLDLTITPSSTASDTRTECAPFTWIDGNVYTSDNNSASHIIPSGASDGCDSIVFLDLTIYPPAIGYDTYVQCSPLTWIDGNTYYQSNYTATDTIFGGSVNGCDSIVTLDFTLNPTAFGTDTRVECGSYQWIDGNVYTSDNNTATYTISGGAADGCDSVVTLDLTIIPSATGTDAISSCNPITWIDGQLYYTSNNTATYIIPNGAATGCDSIVTLNFTKLAVPIGVDTRTECAPYTWMDGNVYTQDNNSASYIIVGGASDGCDSTVILDLTVIPEAIGYDYYVQCTGLTWIDGNTYTESTYGVEHIIPNGAASGCDSTVVLNLTIQPSAYGTDTRVECAPYTWIDGLTYTHDNNTAVYLYAGGAADGCDSLVTLDLSIYPINTTVTDQGGYLLADANNGETYQWIDCNNGNQPITGETNQLFVPTMNGSYAVIIDDGTCSDTSFCYTVNNAGIGQNAVFGDLITIYPNPTKSIVNVDLGGTYPEVTIQVKNQLGQVIQTIDNKGNQIVTIDLGTARGVYFLDILAPSHGHKIARVIVQ